MYRLTIVLRYIVAMVFGESKIGHWPWLQRQWALAPVPPKGDSRRCVPVGRHLPYGGLTHVDSQWSKFGSLSDWYLADIPPAEAPLKGEPHAWERHGPVR